MPTKVVSAALKKMFGSRNERLVKKYERLVELVSAREPDVRPLTDQEIRKTTETFRERIRNGENARDMMPEVFALAREAMDRAVGLRNIFNPEKNFDPTQLPADLQSVYAETKKLMDETPPAAPEGAFLGGTEPIPSWQFVDIPVELYEGVRALYEKSTPPFRARPFDVQIIGALVLYEGQIAEMKTGEGKTIVAPLATFLAAVEGQQVHVVTVNDYLVQRDRDWTFPFFRALGLTVGAIHPYHMQPPQMKQQAYECDVVYGTTAEFGFDYLRDNMKLSVSEQVQTHRDFAIVDEVDSTLIDEARTPLIISGPAHQSSPRYDLADSLARHLVERQKDWARADAKVQTCLVDISTYEGDVRQAHDKSDVPAIQAKLEAAKNALPDLEAERDRYVQFYEVELDKKKAQLTHEGIEEAQRKSGLGSFYTGENIDLPHLLEQSIRAHAVYQRDRDYVVAPDEDGTLTVVIVDQNTGRKMVGRQWSDGLHQAVEAKEGVPIKEETQTMATITIQNFYKLYDKLAGMTGTADTEATEFYEIYKLDVVVIPTNVPIARGDHNDVIYMTEKDKWDSIVEEIKRFHDAGRPVLVGTTSVEKSELLSRMLTSKYQIKHEVLNAKQHEREADIVQSAGQLGAVMVATNMAGRGTDIQLAKFTREELIDHWKRRGLAPRETNASMPDDEIIASVYRHIAPKELGLKKGDVEPMSDSEIRLALLRRWAQDICWVAENKANGMSEEALVRELDASGASQLHALRMFENVADLGGLHVVGTERHESRRIDNQLRGRSGRQGDNGSTRFFLSLEDDLMKMFAGDTTKKVLSRLGMKQGDAIEHPMLSKSIGRAQRKVEERNFLIRKNILEYDEVMDHQRHQFYAMRQSVLEGYGINDVIFEHIEQSAADAVHTYLDKHYVANCIAEWVRENLSVSIDTERIRRKQIDRGDLHNLIVIDTKEEAGNVIDITLGEYMPEDLDPSEWDLPSLSAWGRSNFDHTIPVSRLKDMARNEVRDELEKAAARKIDAADLAPLDQFIVPLYGEKELAKWAANKFAGEFEPEMFAELEHNDDAVDAIMNRARDAYKKREVEYPIEFAIDMTTAGMQQNPQHAVQQFCRWVNVRYELEWSPTALPSGDPGELRRILLEEAQKWDDDRFARRAEKAVAAAGTSPEALDEWFREHAGAVLLDREKALVESDSHEAAITALRRVHRSELTQFERWVLLQIVDQAWKDHLYAVDQLRESIGLRSFSQKDPRIEFKREGARLFEEMWESIRDKVTDLIFKARLSASPAAPQRPADQGPPAGGQPAAPGPAQPATAAAAAAAADAGTATQRADIEAAQRAGAAATDAVPKAAPQRTSTPTIGRNEVVTIVHPTTGEKQQIKYKKAQPLIREGWRIVTG